MPAIAVLVVAITNYIQGNSALNTFHMLSKEQFLGAMLGFMSYFFAILFNEVGKEFKVADAVGILPGSFIEALKLSRATNSKVEISTANSRVFNIFQILIYEFLHFSCV